MEDLNINTNLDNNENILLKLKPNKRSFILSNFIMKILPVILILLIEVFIFTFIFITLSNNSKEIPIAFIITFITLLCIDIIIFGIVIVKILTHINRYKYEYYIITNKKMIIVTGNVKANITVIYFDKINSINLKVGIIEKLFNVGDIYILLNNQTIILQDIINPYEIHSQIEKIIHNKSKE